MNDADRQRLTDLADAIQAYLRGEPVEFSSITIDDWEICEDPNFSSRLRWRTHRPPTPWDCPEDVPGPVCWLKSRLGRIALVTEISEENVCLTETILAFGSLDTWLYSIDRRTWKPCVKEAR